MCVALPGTVLELDGDVAIVDFSGNQVRARAGLVPVVPGDRVLVHAGCILQKVSTETADEMEDLFREIDEVLSE
jgi:hydrogenase expression/formation protein HypC